MLSPGPKLCRDGSLCPPGCCQRYQCCRPRLWRRDKKTSLQETGFASLQSLVCQSWLVKTRLHLRGRPSSRHQAAPRREREAPWSRGVAKHARRLPAPRRGAQRALGLLSGERPPSSPRLAPCERPRALGAPPAAALSAQASLFARRSTSCRGDENARRRPCEFGNDVGSWTRATPTRQC